MLRQSVGFELRKLTGVATVTAAIASLIIVATALANVSFTYDAGGRLVGVNNSGCTASYNYDAAGNLLSITNPSSQTGAYAIIPSSGPVGTAVTIVGCNFSSVPALNVVAFSTADAAVVGSSTATTINTTVPSGAVTGPVSITTTNGSATVNFTVTQ